MTDRTMQATPRMTLDQWHAQCASRDKAFARAFAIGLCIGGAGGAYVAMLLFAYLF